MITNAVASEQVKSNEQLRPPSPATGALMPIIVVPGSPYPPNAVANIRVKSKTALRPPSPARQELMPNERVPGSLFQQRGDSND